MTLRLLRTTKNDEFFNLLEAQAQAAQQAAREFYALTIDFSNRKQYVERIARIEHEADGLTHQMSNKLDSTFVTPLDKEDLRALSSALDDITDFVEAAVQRIMLYRLESPRPDLAPLVDLLVKTTEATCEVIATVRRLQKREKINDKLIRVHELENESDHAFRSALAELFNTPTSDPLTVIKWKEIYDRVEIAVDKCEDVAKIVESIAVTYA